MFVIFLQQIIHNKFFIDYNLNSLYELLFCLPIKSNNNHLLKIYYKNIINIIYFYFL